MSGADADRERGGISRRKVLLGGSMLATGYLAWRWVRGGPEDVVVAILERHGAIAVGPTLRDALVLLETLEHAARILSLATVLMSSSGCAGPRRCA